MLKKSITKRNRTTVAFVVYSLLAVLLAVYHHATSPGMGAASLSLGFSAAKPVELPYLSSSSPQIVQFSVEVPVEYRPDRSARYRVVPDDCVTRIQVGGKTVDLNRLVNGNVCDFKNGFVIDLAPYLRPGENRVSFLLDDSDGGSRGFSLARISTSFLAHGLKAVFLLWGYLAAFMLARRIGLPFWLSVVFGMAVMVRLFYFGETPWSSRSYDADGHLEYIKWIAMHGTVPDADTCWLCYHPPLYFLLAAAVFRLFASISIDTAITALQLLSLLLNVGFLLFVLKSLQLVIRNRFTLVAVSAMILFMPSLVVHAVRIGNDALLYFGYAGAFYFYLQWLKSGKGYWWMLLLAGVAFAAKTNGAIVMAVLGSAFLVRLAIAGGSRQAVKPILVAIAFFAVLIGSMQLLQHQRGSVDIVGNTGGLNQRLFVPNEPANYLYFDLKTYLQEPYTNPWDDRLGRDSYWNYLLKTSLFGEFGYAGDAARTLAVLMSALYLVIIATAFYGMLRLRSDEVVSALPFLFNALFLIAASIYLRASVPASCSNDFRYIVPLVLSGGYFAGYGLEVLRRQQVFAYPLLVSAVALFALFGGVFIFAIE